MAEMCWKNYWKTFIKRYFWKYYKQLIKDKKITAFHKEKLCKTVFGKSWICWEKWKILNFIAIRWPIIVIVFVADTCAIYESPLPIYCFVFWLSVREITELLASIEKQRDAL